MFDLAFLLNHLLLKTIHRPQAREGYEACGRAFLDAYGPVEDMPYLLGLVGCLMLARVDGKSPAEYLTEPERERARAAGIALLSDPPSSLGRRGQVFDREPVDDAVYPLAVTEVRAPLAALEHEPRTLGVPHGPFVEAVDLELEPVEAELLEEMALEQPRRLVSQLLAAVVGMDCEAAELGDAVRPATAREAHDAGPLAVGLDDEHAEHLRLLVGALDVGEDALAIRRPRRGEKRLHILVPGEADEEVEVVRARAADDHAHKISSTVFGRRHETTRPDPSATPRRIRDSPITMPAVIGSSRNSAP